MADGAEVKPGAAAEAAEPVFTVDGNRLTLLPDGPGRLDALLALIDGAQSSLRLLYYMFCDDGAGRRVCEACQRAAARGVRVRLIVDGFGSDLPNDYFAPLKAEGADVCQFLPRFGRRYLLRNHQKLALADGEGDDGRVIVGGFNVQDAYFSDGQGWRDLGLLVEGKAAGWLAGYFDALADWTHQDKAKLKDLRRAVNRWSEHRGEKLRWLIGGPTRRLSPWAATVKREIERAHRLDLVAGYFAPNPRMMRSIEGVPARGGQARVLTPAKTDHKAAVAAARHTFARLLRRGVRVFEYQPTKLHTKLYVIDDVVHLGSANFDMRSLFLNMELMLRVEDEAFGAHMRAYFEGELARSREVTREEHAKAGFADRLRWSAAYFVMAVLDASVTRRLSFGIDD